MRKKRSKPFKPTQSESPRLPRPSMRSRKVVPQKERTPEERERALMQPVISMEPLCRKQSKPPLPAARRMGKTGWTGVPPKQREGATREAPRRDSRSIFKRAERCRRRRTAPSPQPGGIST
jgi:hypothetical protein